ncbi:MAG: radical SAM protein, partial [Myxococcota bacterium]
EQVEALYQQVVTRHHSARVARRRGPWRITFDTNPDTCNLRCVMCEEHSPHSPLQVLRKAEGRPRRVMPFELIERVVADAAGHGLEEIIPSTMGEPLLYEHFEDILALCRRHAIKLNLTTNGTFPRLGARAWAERIVPVTSDVKISWNGATQETQEAIMVGSRWDEMVDNVRAFIAVRDRHAAAGGNRCRVTFQLTFLESNVGELADIVRLACELGVDRVKGHHLWAHFDEIAEQSMRRSPTAICRWNEAVREARAVAAELTLPGGGRVLLDNIFPLDEAATEDLAPGGPCPFLGQEAWVSAHGCFDPCCAPDAQRRTLGKFGEVHERGFMEIWNGAAYRELVATYRNRELCLGCNMRKPAGELS